MTIEPRSNVPAETRGKGTFYFRVHWPNGKPSALYFRVVRTSTTLQMERYDWKQKKWIVDGEMLDYYIGYEPGAFYIPEDQAPKDGQALPGETPG